METTQKKQKGKLNVEFDCPEIVNEVQIIYKRPKLDSMHKVCRSKGAYNILKNVYPAERIMYKEFFYVVFLNTANFVLAVSKLSEGGITGTYVDVREIFQLALKINATAIILSHNHPSGRLEPSQQDKQLTKKIQSAGEILDINVLDHLIITAEGYMSFVDEGLI